MAINVDFDSLHDVNPEIYAWIEVPGTNINYAVVQSAADDLFYDDHGVDRSYYSGGSIFSQRYNTTTFQDPVTVLYGHNRQSQTMFAQVNNFADAAFFAKNQKIFVYTPDKVYEYTIFAAYPHSSEHLLLCHDFTDPQAVRRLLRLPGGGHQRQLPPGAVSPGRGQGADPVHLLPAESYAAFPGPGGADGDL